MAHQQVDVAYTLVFSAQAFEIFVYGVVGIHLVRAPQYFSQYGVAYVDTRLKQVQTNVVECYRTEIGFCFCPDYRFRRVEFIYPYLVMLV